MASSSSLQLETELLHRLPPKASASQGPSSTNVGKLKPSWGRAMFLLLALLGSSSRGLKRHKRSMTPEGLSDVQHMPSSAHAFCSGRSFVCAVRPKKLHPAACQLKPPTPSVSCHVLPRLLRRTKCSHIPHWVGRFSTISKQLFSRAPNPLRARARRFLRESSVLKQVMKKTRQITCTSRNGTGGRPKHSCRRPPSILTSHKLPTSSSFIHTACPIKLLRVEEKVNFFRKRICRVLRRIEKTSIAWQRNRSVTVHILKRGNRKSASAEVDSEETQELALETARLLVRHAGRIKLFGYQVNETTTLQLLRAIQEVFSGRSKL